MVPNQSLAFVDGDNVINRQQSTDPALNGVRNHHSPQVHRLAVNRHVDIVKTTGSNPVGPTKNTSVISSTDRIQGYEL